MKDLIHSHLSPQHSQGRTSGPLPFLNPTTRRFSVLPTLPAKSEHETGPDENRPGPSKTSDGADDELRASAVEQKWRSRDNRKGRHAINVTLATADDAKFPTPPPLTSTLRATLRGIWRMLTTFPYWDISYLVSIIFTLGSVVWCINGIFVWLPLQDPGTEFSGEIKVGGGITAFLGATIFEIGSCFLMVEALNENRSDCFGWALAEALEERGLIRLRPDTNGCTHHHNKRAVVGYRKASEGKPPHGNPTGHKNHPDSRDARTWIWLPTWHELKTHYFKEIGFLACLFQLIGATVFWISGFTGLPVINDSLSPAALNGAYWSVQIIGGSGFIISSFLFMLETQRKWYLPALKVLGWHVGIWNLIGALGFTLCGALGLCEGEEELYQSSLATFWGSWAFLIGSTIQWYESLVKYPVEVEEGQGGLLTCSWLCLNK